MQKPEGQGVVLIATSSFCFHMIITPALGAPSILIQEGRTIMNAGRQSRMEYGGSRRFGQY